MPQNDNLLVKVSREVAAAIVRSALIPSYFRSDPESKEGEALIGVNDVAKIAREPEKILREGREIRGGFHK